MFGNGNIKLPQLNWKRIAVLVVAALLGVVTWDQALKDVIGGGLPSSFSQPQQTRAAPPPPAQTQLAPPPAAQQPVPQNNQPKAANDNRAPAAAASNNGQFSDKLRGLIHAQISGQMVLTSAVVLKLLPDDTQGSQHQRFLIADSDRETVLIAHNIDLAKRVPVQAGDIIQVYGQYEWNEKGGVLHWTHHDPNGRHADGWIEFNGQRYQ